MYSYDYEYVGTEENMFYPVQKHSMHLFSTMHVSLYGYFHPDC